MFSTRRAPAPHQRHSLCRSVSSDGLSHPAVRIELDGVAGEFPLDTGSGGQVFVSDKFQRENAIVARQGKILTVLTPGGVGGRASVWNGLGRQLRIGPTPLSPPFVGGPATAGEARLGGAGVIGNGILAMFVVTIDHHSGRVYFEPIPGRSLPTAMIRTGLVVDKPNRDAFEVIDMFKGSPAERSGMKRGDRIIEIAGRPARDLGMRDLAVGRTGMTVRTERQRFDLGVGQILP